MNRPSRIHETLARHDERHALRREARATIGVLVVMAIVGALGLCWIFGLVWREL